MSDIYFVNEKTKRKYKVVKFDKDAGKVTLVGELGVEFTEAYTRERFEGFGYTLQSA